MKPLGRFYRLNCMVPLVLTMLICGSGTAVPLRLDLYDAANNHLMYAIFHYDGTGRNNGRSVFMADSTFVRRAVIKYDEQGRRQYEISYNFNDDEVYTINYQHGAGVTSFGITDYFDMDFVGGMVTYTSGAADQVKYDLFYQDQTTATSMTYEKDGQGNLTKVTVTDPTDPTSSYVGVFTHGEVGVSQPEVRSAAAKGSQAVVRARGGSVIEVSFELPGAGDVRCELMSLSGRRAGVLFSGKLAQGPHTRSFRLDGGAAAVASGVYLLDVSVNGVTVSRSRYLHQRNVNAGGVR